MRIHVILAAVLVFSAWATPSANAEPAQERRTTVAKDGTLQLSAPVRFESGGDALATGSDATLEEVRAFLEQNPDVTLLRIEGHTSTKGTAAYNLELSKRYAMTVARWLVSKGVSCYRLIPVAFGETKPIVGTEKGAADGAANRRVSFAVAHRKGKPIGGLPADGGAPAVAGDPCR